MSARILVVDDVPDNVLLLSDLVSAQGHLPIPARSGEEALATIRSRPVDVVLLDVVMPEMDGFEVCRAIRADPKMATLPIVMVTALDPAQERVKGLDAGADDFLGKPIVVEELLARLRSLLRIKALHDMVEAQRAELAAWNATLQSRVDEQVEQIEQLSRLKRFFSPKLAELIVAGGVDDPLRSHRCEVAVVFADLRGFTSFAATAEPEEMMGTLREFHHAMGRVITNHDGTLERFTGDGMMVFFNDPVPVADPVGRAIRMALDMQRAFQALSGRGDGIGFELGLAIGIAHGMATIGAIGFEERIDYGAIGLVTNLAARMCDEARAGEILADEATLSRAGAGLDSESIGRFSIKGFPRPIAVFRVKGERVGAAQLAPSAEISRRPGH